MGGVTGVRLSLLLKNKSPRGLPQLDSVACQIQTTPVKGLFSVS